ncbi:MAG: polysaccharide deacetylase family protein, partial [Clostridia bacterium]|nr:polysaccharide deacetylase family protein [Clostridia bacterium]
MFRLPVIYTCFPGGKHKVLTMSYDDGRQEDYRLVELFNKHGIKGTFNLNAGIDWDDKRVPFSDYKTLYEGHEVACHTYTHPTIARCPLEQVAQQI